MNAIRTLVAGSWLLLVGFVGFWWYQSYQTAETVLRERGSSLLASIRSGALIEQLTFLADSIPNTLTGNSEADTSEVQFRLYNFRATTVLDTTEGGSLDSMDLSEFLRPKPVSPEIFQNMLDSRWTDSLLHSDLPDNLRVIVLDTSVRDVTFRPDSGNPLTLPFPSERTVDTGNQFGYLMRQILPQIIFGLVLIALVSAALWLTYLSFIRQRRLSIAQRQFVDNMTHELQTPITTVGIALEQLETNELSSERRREYFGIGKHELNRMSLLVDKMLTLNRFQQDKLIIQTEPTDLDQLLQSVLPSFQLIVDQRNGQLQYLRPLKSYPIRGHAQHLTNVLYNLLDNAVKYSPERLEITVELLHQHDCVILRIRDRGMGISRAYQSRIFDRFVRVPAAGDRHDVKGHGLGLSYVRAVIENLGGTITVHSEPGRGSTFTLQFPLP